MKNRMTPMKQMAVLLVLLGAVASHGRAVEFAPAKSYTVGIAPIGVVEGDFNGDGKVDLVVANNGSGNVSVLLGNGDGTFRPAVSFDAGISAPESIFVGDFNGDGKLDVAVFQSGNSVTLASGEVSILLGNGDGSFKAPMVTTLTVSAAAIAVGDFNGDKRTDLVVSGSDPATNAVGLQILLGKGDGTFLSANPVNSNIQNVNFATADFNNDGKLDLAIAVPGGVQVLVGHGDGTFIAAGTATVATGYEAQTILTGDFNKDGKLDLIVDSRESSCSGSIIKSCAGKQNVSVFLGNGDASFGAEQIFAQGAYTRSSLGPDINTELENIVACDLNGDGNLDVVDHLPLGNRLQIWLGKGDGTFSSTPPTSIYPGLVGVVSDLNGDSLNDVLALDSSNSSLLILLNTSPTSGADLDINDATVPATVGLGINLTYSADVLNEGPQSATNVIFIDTLPIGVTFVSATSTRGICSESNQKVTCTIGELASVADAQIGIVVTPTVAGAITNTMNISAAETDLAPANNQATQTSTIVPVYTLTVSKSGDGSGTVTDGQSGLAGLPINCGIRCSAQYLSGTDINLSAGADSGSFFQAWNGACSAVQPGCSLTMDGDKNLTAVFVLGAKLTVAFAGGGNGTVSSSDNTLSCSNAAGTCSSVYKPGTSISLTAAPSGTSVFGSWSGACTGTDPNKCSIALNSDEMVTATFSPAPDFSLSPAAKSLTAATGGQATDVISISEQGGFSSAIQLTCSVAGPAPMPTCALSPATIPPGANSPTSTLTITAPGKLAFLSAQRKWQTRAPYVLGIALLIALLWLSTILYSFNGERSTRSALRMVGGLAYAVILISLSACGGASSPPPPQTFTITVTAASGTLQHATSVSVTVQ